jgi:AraC-like DNA-binding protein
MVVGLDRDMVAAMAAHTWLESPMLSLGAGPAGTASPSEHRAPSPALAAHVARFILTIVDRPADAVLDAFLLHETAYIRLPVEGRWQAQIGGRWVEQPGPVIFGAQSRRLPVRYAGPVVLASIPIPPAAWHCFFAEPAEAFADGVAAVADPWRERLLWACADIRDKEETFRRLETVMQERVAAAPRPPDATSAWFERIARQDPARPVAAIAREAGLDPRAFNHLVRDHFGHPPKTVLRRSRFLDMASAMRGLGRSEEQAVAELRYYDASHLNRECRLFVGMTPAQFRRTPTPMFTSGLEVRKHRQLADRLSPEGAAPPTT